MCKLNQEVYAMTLTGSPAIDRLLSSFNAHIMDKEEGDTGAIHDGVEK
jgi:hypothetical protein